jgi:uncharacterized membrane protein
MAHCTKCGAALSEGTAFCGTCGGAQSGIGSPATGATVSQSGGIDSNIAAALAYLWFVAIAWLVLEPYNKDRFIRFHSFQALAFGVVWFVLTTVLSMIPFVGWLLLIPVLPLGLVVWLVCMFKAFSKAWFKLPVIGDWALQQAGPAQS